MTESDDCKMNKYDWQQMIFVNSTNDTAGTNFQVRIPARKSNRTHESSFYIEDRGKRGSQIS